MSGAVIMTKTICRRIELMFDFSEYLVSNVANWVDELVFVMAFRNS